jgi:hypothetical protein
MRRPLLGTGAASSVGYQCAVLAKSTPPVVLQMGITVDGFVQGAKGYDYLQAERSS